MIIIISKFSFHFALASFKQIISIKKLTLRSQQGSVAERSKALV